MAEASPDPERTTKSNDMPPQDRFFLFFQRETTDLQEKMGRLEKTSTVGGERTDAIQHLVAGIARLAGEVSDASGYLPAYDQKTCGQVVKGLREKLDQTRRSLGARPRFAFRSVHRAPPSLSPSDPAELTAQNRHGLQHTQRSDSFPPVPVTLKPRTEAAKYTEEADSTEAAVASESSATTGEKSGNSSTARQEPAASSPFTINQQSNTHIIVPSPINQRPKLCKFSSLQSCIVDVSSTFPLSSTNPPPSLTIKDVNHSLLICGRIEGSAHVTAMSDSVLVLGSRQLRMHGCRDVDVYLSCASRPVLEDCRGIRFATLPEAYVCGDEKKPATTKTAPKSSSSSSSSEPTRPANPSQETTSRPPTNPTHPPQNPPRNLWSQPLDFNNPTTNTDTSSAQSQSEPHTSTRTPSSNPTWSLLRPESEIGNATWRDIIVLLPVLGGRDDDGDQSSVAREDVLRMVGVCAVP